MAYKKPQIIAKSEPKQTYVAGCPNYRSIGCGSTTRECWTAGAL